MTKSVDYRQVLLESAETGQHQTAHGVLPEDMDSLTHRLRYQAGKLGLVITINTDPEKHTVSFLTSRKEIGKRGK